MAYVLIAEDEAFTAMEIADTLVNRGHTVRDASDGAQAISILRDFSACVLVTDLMMPKVDGAELVRHVRSAGGAPIAVVLITGVPESKLPADLQYDAYLGKPIDHEQLGRLVDGFADRCGC